MDALLVEVENVSNDVERVERVLDKLEENNTKLTSICSEIKAMTAMQSRRLEHVENDVDKQRSRIDTEKIEFNRTMSRLHDKIEQSEEKNERKIDDAVDKLSLKIDGLCEKSGARIDGLSHRLDKYDKYKWLVVGAAFGSGLMLAKFDFVKQFLTILIS